MRQWPDDPRTICNQHLLGEHVEHHMMFGAIRKGHSIQGYLDNGLIDPPTLESRHDLIAAEMTRRGMNHASPLKIDGLKIDGIPIRLFEPNPLEPVGELSRRCEDCRSLSSP